MGAIYKIYNDVNDKVYIGQTVRTAERRWAEHKNAAINELYRETILYNAMRKYGVDKFHMIVIRECDESELDYYEELYINAYNSLAPNGYNMTTGGEKGKKLDYDDVVKKYFECGQNETEVQRRYGIQRSTVAYILKEKGYTPQPNYIKQGIEYYECDADNNIIGHFNNAMEIVEKYKDLDMTVAGIHNYIAHQMNERHKSYRGKYFCRVYDYDIYKTRNHKGHRGYKPVCCIETGMEFEKLADAARWVLKTYPEYQGSIDTIAANISKAIKNNHNSYKHSWKFIEK